MCVCNKYIQLQSATKIRRSRFRRAYTDAASETLTPSTAAGQVLATSAVVPPVSITVRVPHINELCPPPIIFFFPTSFASFYTVAFREIHVSATPEKLSFIINHIDVYISSRILTDLSRSMDVMIDFNHSLLF